MMKPPKNKLLKQPPKEKVLDMEDMELREQQALEEFTQAFIVPEPNVGDDNE